MKRILRRWDVRLVLLENLRFLSKWICGRHGVSERNLHGTGFDNQTNKQIIERGAFRAESMKCKL